MFASTVPAHMVKYYADRQVSLRAVRVGSKHSGSWKEELNQQGRASQ